MGRGNAGREVLPLRPHFTAPAPVSARYLSGQHGDRIAHFDLEIDGAQRRAFMFAYTNWTVLLEGARPCATVLSHQGDTVICGVCGSGCEHAVAGRLGVDAGVVTGATSPLFGLRLTYEQGWGALVERSGRARPDLFAAFDLFTPAVNTITLLLSADDRSRWHLSRHVGARCLICDTSTCALSQVARTATTMRTQTLSAWMAIALPTEVVPAQSARYGIGSRGTQLHVTLAPTPTEGTWKTSFIVGDVTAAEAYFEQDKPVCTACAVDRPCVHDRILPPGT